MTVKIQMCFPPSPTCLYHEALWHSLLRVFADQIHKWVAVWAPPRPQNQTHHTPKMTTTSTPRNPTLWGSPPMSKNPKSETHRHRWLNKSMWKRFSRKPRFASHKAQKFAKRKTPICLRKNPNCKRSRPKRQSLRLLSFQRLVGSARPTHTRQPLPPPPPPSQRPETTKLRVIGRGNWVPEQMGLLHPRGASGLTPASSPAREKEYPSLRGGHRSLQLGRGTGRKRCRSGDGNPVSWGPRSVVALQSLPEWGVKRCRPGRGHRLPGLPVEWIERVEEGARRRWLDEPVAVLHQWVRRRRVTESLEKENYCPEKANRTRNNQTTAFRSSSSSSRVTSPLTTLWFR